MQRLDLVDYLRGYAIFLIMIYHYFLFFALPFPYDKLIAFGGTGIHLFFVLSGLGLALTMKNKPLGFKEFLKRRFSKTYIPYIITVTVSALISLIIPIYDNSLYAYLGHVFLYKMFDETIMGSYGYPLWFVSTIIQFYLVYFPLSWMKSKLKDVPFFLISFVLSLIWALFVYKIGKSPIRIWNSFFLQYLWEFSLGMIIAERLSNSKSIINFKFKSYHYLIIGMVNIGIYGFLALKANYLGKMTNDLFALIGYSFFAIWLFSLNLKPFNQFFLYVGKISFSVYLLHIALFLLINHFWADLNFVFVIVLSASATIFLARYYQQLIGKLYRVLKI